MDYVDWVQEVMTGVVKAWRQTKGNAKIYEGLTVQEIGLAMGFSAAELAYAQGRPAEALLNALADLDQLGFVERQNNPGYFKVPQRGLAIVQAGLSAMWGQMVSTHLEDDQLQVLTKLAETCREGHDTYVCLRERQLNDLKNDLRSDWDQAGDHNVYSVVQQLAEIGLAKMGGGFGNFNALPTYWGIVRVTRQVDTHWQAKLRTLLPEWETTNVDFKQELNLKPPTEKAEFAKDIMALITTKSSGERLMVIGFDDKTHRFYQSVDPSITQDRLEDILKERVEPFPIVKYHTVIWEAGAVGIVEISREPHKLPYKAKREMVAKSGRITEGDVFVRHGTHNAKLLSGDQELQDLIDEGNKARQ